MLTRTLAVLLAVLVSVSLAFADDEPVVYTVHLERPQTQIVTIEMTISSVDTDTLPVSMPVWRPGKYVVLDNASDIRTLAAYDGADNALPVVKDGKSTWLITTNGAPTVRVVYDLYCNDISNRTRHVDDTHAFLSGSAVFLFSPDFRDQPCRVEFVDTPDGWTIATGLESADDNAVVAPDYDLLVDSPIEIGIHDLLKFQVDGTPFEIAIWGKADYDADRLRRDFADIVREQAAIFGSLPFDRYVFLISVGPGLGGGTEHYNSTVMHASPSRFDSPDAYRSFLGLAAHEFFHTWNVKRFRPAGLSPYNYLEENYTPSLWLAEGTTSYYDDLTLARAGLIDIGEYLSRIRGSIDGYESRAGGGVQSLEESSHDAWIKFNRSGPDRDNTTVSFYRKGSLASLIIDAEIRRATNNRKSLDDVMKILSERFDYGSPGYTPQDVVEIASAVAGTDLDPLFARAVRGTEPLDLAETLSYFGIEMVRDRVKTAWEKEDDLDGAPERPYLGLNLSGTRVRSVHEHSPAFDAGFNADDELVAIDGHRVGSSNYGSLESNLVIGEETTITYFRRDELRTATLTVGATSNTKLSLKRVKNPTPEQIAAYEAWLDQPWPDKDKPDADAQPGDEDDTDPQ